MEAEDNKASAPVVFKSIKKKRAIRQRKLSSDDEEEEGEGPVGGDDRGGDGDFNREALLETMEKQKLRQRAIGVSSITLASGQKVSKAEVLAASEEAAINDPFKLKSGGLLDLNSARRARAVVDGADDPSEAVRGQGVGNSDVVGTQFSKETRIRDEDEEMRKFIEAEMEKRRGKTAGADGADDDADAYMSPEDRALMSLPDHLRKSTFKKNEEMLSSQMLSGIPEVDLGIEEKIRNIEATEAAKKRLQKDEVERKKRSRPSEFVPSNMAVNFKQPDRFRDETEVQEKKSRQSANAAAAQVTQRTVKVGDVPEERVVAGGAGDGGQPADGNKATDDLHLSKFKSHFHRSSDKFIRPNVKNIKN